jgi:hypothetical protein
MKNTTENILKCLSIEDLDAYSVFSSPAVAEKTKELAKLINETEEFHRVDECVRSILYEINMLYQNGDVLYAVSREYTLQGIIQECESSPLRAIIQN